MSSGSSASSSAGAADGENESLYGTRSQAEQIPMLCWRSPDGLIVHDQRSMSDAPGAHSVGRPTSWSAPSSAPGIIRCQTSALWSAGLLWILTPAAHQHGAVPRLVAECPEAKHPRFAMQTCSSGLGRSPSRCLILRTGRVGYDPRRGHSNGGEALVLSGSAHVLGASSGHVTTREYPPET